MPKSSLTKTLWVLAALVLLSLTAWGGTVHYTYDLAGRLIRVDYDNGKTIEYVYDAAGNMLQRSVYGGAVACAHVASSSVWNTRFSLVNLGPNNTTATFKAFREDGTELESVESVAIPPNGSLDGDFDAVFTPATLAQGIWAKIIGNTDLKGVITFGTRDNLTLVTIPMFANGAPDLIFPYVYSADIWYTGITLINPGTTAVNATLEAFDETGQSLGTVAADIPAMGKYVRLVEYIGFAVANPVSIRSIQVTCAKPLIGFELFGRWDELGLAGLPAFSPSTSLFKKSARAASDRADHTVYYNEIPDIGIYYTGVTFSNLGDTQSTVHVTLYDANGNVLGENNWPVEVREQITREIWWLFDGAEVPAAAYLKATAPQQLMGFELFLTRDTSQHPFQFDGVIGMSGGSKKLVFPLIRSTDGWTTYLRITNLSSAENQIQIHSYAADGTALGTSSHTLIPGGRLNHLLQELQPARSGPIAWVQVEAAGDITADAFYYSTDMTRLSSYMGLTNFR